MKQEVYKYNLSYDRNGGWLGDIILTKEGLFFSNTDVGDFTYDFYFGSVVSSNNDVRTFFLEMDKDYFLNKIIKNLSDFSASECKEYVNNILPALKEAIKKELEDEA